MYILFLHEKAMAAFFHEKKKRLMRLSVTRQSCEKKRKKKSYGHFNPNFVLLSVFFCRKGVLCLSVFSNYQDVWTYYSWNVAPYLSHNRRQTQFVITGSSKWALDFTNQLNIIYYQQPPSHLFLQLLMRLAENCKHSPKSWCFLHHA